MRVTRHEEYGLRLAMRLAGSDGQLTVRQLADEEALPEATVAKVVARLRRGGIVTAERGRNGGYQLSEPPSVLTVAQVVDACGKGLFNAQFCSSMSPSGACAHNTSCGLRPVWRGLTDVIGNFLSQITVAELVRGSRVAAAGHTGPTPLHSIEPVGSPHE